jgi:CubicO group peptidase (beta-lactamase class C family)
MSKRSLLAVSSFVLALGAARSEAQPWQARHGLTAAQYQSEFNTWTSQGYRLTHVSGYDVTGQPRFAAIWEQKPGPAWVARHGMTAAQYQTEFNTWVGQGYRLTLVDGYESAGSARYAAIWELKAGPAWVAQHGLTGAQYQDEFEKWTDLGYRLSWVEGYGVGATAYYAAIWEKTAGPGWVARHGLTSAQYQAEYNNWVGQQGYRLTHVSGYEVSGTDYYAAIWEHVSGPAMVARHRLTASGYQHEFVDRLLQGYRLKLVDGYSIGSGARYAAIWEAEPGAATGSYCKNGQCFDLGRAADGIEDALQRQSVKYGFEIRRGRTVIRRAQGPKRTAADLPAADFTVHDRFNPASVSKTVTAIATLQLLTKSNVGINAPIYTHLPPDWNIPAPNKTITFKEVLNHTSGLRGANAGGHEYSHMQTLMEHPINLADKVPEYENVNYSLLRILVASLDGMSSWNVSPGPLSAARFINYVNDHIFAPLGIEDVAYQPEATAPTLFYPEPPGNAHGTAYGNWSLKPGSAGCHTSVHELAVFVDAIFKGLLISPAKIGELKTHGLGMGSKGLLPDGSECWSKGGYFPGSMNGGAQLSTSLFSCNNGVSGMLVVNGTSQGSGVYLDALKAAFQAP